MNSTVSELRLNRFLDQLAPLRRKRYRFALAIAMAFLALAFTGLAQWIFGSPAVLLFAAGVVVTTGLFGFLAGLCTALVAMPALDFFYLPPVFAFSFDEQTWRIGIGLGLLAAGTHVIERRLSARIRSEVKPPLGIHGSLDGLEHGELYGWAFDADNPDRAVEVTLFVDKRPVAHVAAVHFRPDVAATMDCSGRHGFYIDMAGMLPEGTDALIDVRLPNGAPVAHAPAVIRLQDVVPRAPKPTVLFMHIPKTAGTAFREAIAENFVQSEIAYIYPTPPGFLVSDLRALPLEQRRAYRIVVGHYQYGMHEALPQKTEYVTIVRDPAARVLSQYAYLQHRQPQLVHNPNGALLSLEELFETRLTVDFDNALVRCFSGVDERDFGPGQLTQEIYEQAVVNLEQEFAFVGHQEESEAAFAALRQRYGWTRTRLLPSVNLGKPRNESGPKNDSERRLIQKHIEWDCLLYEEILKRFPRS